jgi:hypothetical protein
LTSGERTARTINPVAIVSAGVAPRICLS